MSEIDLLVIGGGTAGASAAYEIVARQRVILLEREAFCGYYSTGRSAASFTENYGNRVIRCLAEAERSFFELKTSGPLLIASPGTITIAREDQLRPLAEMLTIGREFVPDLPEIPRTEVLALVPIRRPEPIAAAVFEPRALDIDVHAVPQFFLAGLKARGGAVVTEAEITALERCGGMWRVEKRRGSFTVSVVVNAAGAWADEVARLAGARPLELVPKRRTAFNIDVPDGVTMKGWPMIDDAGGEFYFKADAGSLLVSPSDATPSTPVDAQLEEIDVAIGVDRIERVATLKASRAPHRWAGLRSFVADGPPIMAAMTTALRGFFWLAAQGGYGIKTALALVPASLVDHGPLPSDLREAGLSEALLSPARCRPAVLAAGAA